MDTNSAANSSPNSSEMIPGFVVIVPEDETYQSPISILHESASKGRNFYLEFVDGPLRRVNGTLESTVNCVINNRHIASGSAVGAKEAKRACAQNALDLLKTCQRVHVKQPICHDGLKTVEKTQLVKEAYTMAPKLDDNNLGSRLLKKMGYKGSGGIGKDGGGIAEPVFVNAADGRKGVGHEDQNVSVKRASVEDTLLAFIRDTSRDEIKFSSDLSSQERALVHKLSQKYGLRHKSFGNKNVEGQRYLVVSRPGKF